MSYNFNTTRQLVEELCHQSGVSLPVRAAEIICKEGLLSYDTLTTYSVNDWSDITGCGIKTAKDIMAWVGTLQKMGGLSREEVHAANLRRGGVICATVTFDRIQRFGTITNRVQVLLPGQSQHNPEYAFEHEDLQTAIDHYGLQAQSWVLRLTRQ